MRRVEFVFENIEITAVTFRCLDDASRREEGPAEVHTETYQNVPIGSYSKRTKPPFLACGIFSLDPSSIKEV